MSKKVFKSMIFILLITCVLFTACQKGKKPQKGENQKSGNEVSKSLPTTLKNPQVKVLVYNDLFKDEFNEAVKLFEERYGGKAEFIMTGSGPEYQEKIIAGISSGDAYDIVRWTPIHMPKWALMGILQPLDDYIDFNEPVWNDVKLMNEALTYKKQHFGVASNGVAIVTYFNKTMFENNGVKTPLDMYKNGKWNWDALRDAASKLTIDTDKDGAVDQWGVGAAGEVLQWLVISNGTDTAKIADDGSIALNISDSKAIEAFQFYQDLFVKDKSYLQKPAQTIIQEFINGKVSMLLTHDDKVPMGTFGDMKYEWDVAPFPVGPSIGDERFPGGGGYWGVCNGAPNAEGAAALLYFKQKAQAGKIDPKSVEGYSESQVNLVTGLRRKVSISRASGIGTWIGELNKLSTELRKGTPVVTAVDKSAPGFQGLIDNLLKDAK